MLKTQDFWVFILSPGDLDSQRRGPRLAAPRDLNFLTFLGPSGQNHQYHTPLLFKILDLTENKKIVNNPFKVLFIVDIFNLKQYQDLIGAITILQIMDSPIQCENNRCWSI